LQQGRGGAGQGQHPLLLILMTVVWCDLFLLKLLDGILLSMEFFIYAESSSPSFALIADRNNNLLRKIIMTTADAGCGASFEILSSSFDPQRSPLLPPSLPLLPSPPFLPTFCRSRKLFSILQSGSQQCGSLSSPFRSLPPPLPLICGRDGVSWRGIGVN
jgi:hypothetical protein